MRGGKVGERASKWGGFWCFGQLGCIKVIDQGAWLLNGLWGCLIFWVWTIRLNRILIIKKQITTQIKNDKQ